jgi:hypothetical protein
MQINVKVDFDLNKLDMGKVFQIGLYNSGQKIQRLAQGNAPYLTGKLSQSIGVDPWVITTNTKKINIGPRKVNYAILREFVNFKNPHRKFYMRRAFEKADEIVQNAFEKAVKMIIPKIKK